MPQLFYKPLEARIAQGKDDARLQAVADAKQQENVRYVNMSDYDKELNRQRLAMFTNQLAPAIVKESGIVPGTPAQKALRSSAVLALVNSIPGIESIKTPGWKWADSFGAFIGTLNNDYGFYLNADELSKLSAQDKLTQIAKSGVSPDILKKVILEHFTKLAALAKRSKDKIPRAFITNLKANAASVKADRERESKAMASEEARTRDLTNRIKNIAGAKIVSTAKRTLNARKVKREADDLAREEFGFAPGEKIPVSKKASKRK